MEGLVFILIWLRLSYVVMPCSSIVGQDVHTAIGMLLVYAKSDTSKLYRVLNCCPSVLKRLSHNESKTTTLAQNQCYCND